MMVSWDDCHILRENGIRGAFFGKNMRMETISEPFTLKERAEFAEFLRTRKEAEVSAALKKLVFDASRREMDKTLLGKICAFAAKNRLGGVLVSPVNVTSAKRSLAGSGVRVLCIVGGTGETLPAVKKYEAKRAARAGASEIVLTPCHSALFSGNIACLKREIKKVRRAVKLPVVLSLEDRALSEEDIALGTRAACFGGAVGVCVRGEPQFLLRAMECADGKLSVDCYGVENAEQLRSLKSLGAARLVSVSCDSLADDLFTRLPAAE